MTRKGGCDIKALGYIISAAVMIILSLFVISASSQEVMAYTEINAEIQVYCMRCTSGGSRDYRLLCENTDSLSPAPEEREILTGEDSMVKFIIPVSEPGTYNYRVSQIPGSMKDTVYDKTVYNVIVYAEENRDGKLVCAVSARKDGVIEKPDRIEFCNTVTGDTTTVTSSATTTATGKATTPKGTVTTAAGTSTAATDPPETTGASSTATGTASSGDPPVSTTQTTVNTSVSTAADPPTSTVSVDSAKTGDDFRPDRLAAVMAAAFTAAVFMRRRRHL